MLTSPLRQSKPVQLVITFKLFQNDLYNNKNNNKLLNLINLLPNIKKINLFAFQSINNPTYYRNNHCNYLIKHCQPSFGQFK